MRKLIWLLSAVAPGIAPPAAKAQLDRTYGPRLRPPKSSSCGTPLPNCTRGDAIQRAPAADAALRRRAHCPADAYGRRGRLDEPPAQ